MATISELIKADAMRMEILNVVESLKLPDCFVAAGFVRNLVWDYLHGVENSSLNDVDVIFFDRNERICEASIEQTLVSLLPNVNWQVKNQAVMHLRNGDMPYSNSTDAMAYWPEKETAVGIRIGDDGELETSAPFGEENLFLGAITHNPKREKSVFLNRIESKGWLKTWPQLKVVTC